MLHILLSVHDSFYFQFMHFKCYFLEGRLRGSLFLNGDFKKIFINMITSLLLLHDSCDKKYIIIFGLLCLGPVSL